MGSVQSTDRFSSDMVEFPFHNGERGQYTISMHFDENFEIQGFERVQDSNF